MQGRKTAEAITRCLFAEPEERHSIAAQNKSGVNRRRKLVFQYDSEQVRQTFRTIGMANGFYLLVGGSLSCAWTPFSTWEVHFIFRDGSHVHPRRGRGVCDLLGCFFPAPLLHSQRHFYGAFHPQLSTSFETRWRR